MAEHGRATTFLMADGVLPSNEDRGYVLRRMLRRLVTHGRKLGVERPVMNRMVEKTVELMGEAYPELRANEPFVLQVAASEEERFGATYRQGITLFEAEAEAATASGSGVFPGDAAFRLHDTFGFQLENTLELAAEQGLAVDTDGYARLMDEQRQRARDARKHGDATEGPLGEIAAAAGPSEFLGYERLSADGRLVGLVVDGSAADAAHEGQRVLLVLSRSPFYAEGGGQVGDAGVVRTAGGLVRVSDTKPGPGGTIVHEGIVGSGEVRMGEEAVAEVEPERRASTARSHTATHVLHHTLRGFLGEHARQAGSLVAPGRLRFDFTHFESVPKGSLEEVEYLANRRLAEDSPVRAYETTYEFARNEGAIALFGEKYGDLVRVVEVGDYSIELCGGTHVRHTGEVALLRVVSEASIGSGFRRIEALVGPDALKQVNVERRLLEEVVEAVGGGDPSGAPERVRRAVARIKELESRLGELRKAEASAGAAALAGAAANVCGVALVVRRVDVGSQKELQELAQNVRGRLSPGPGATVLGSVAGGKPLLVAACTNALIEGLGVEAPALIRRAAEVIGGGGGGKGSLAFAGGRRPEALDEALAGVEAELRALLDCA